VLKGTTALLNFPRGIASQHSTSQRIATSLNPKGPSQ
jgi:hypothetical protein